MSMDRAKWIKGCKKAVEKYEAKQLASTRKHIDELIAFLHWWADVRDTDIEASVYDAEYPLRVPAMIGEDHYFVALESKYSNLKGRCHDDYGYSYHSPGFDTIGEAETWKEDLIRVPTDNLLEEFQLHPDEADYTIIVVKKLSFEHSRDLWRQWKDALDTMGDIANPSGYV